MYYQLRAESTKLVVEEVGASEVQSVSIVYLDTVVKFDGKEVKAGHGDGCTGSPSREHTSGEYHPMPSGSTTSSIFTEVPRGVQNLPLALVAWAEILLQLEGFKRAPEIIQSTYLSCLLSQITCPMVQRDVRGIYFVSADSGGTWASGGDAGAHDPERRSAATRGKLLPYIGGEGGGGLREVLKNLFDPLSVFRIPTAPCLPVPSSCGKERVQTGVFRHRVTDTLDTGVLSSRRRSPKKAINSKKGTDVAMLCFVAAVFTSIRGEGRDRRAVLKEEIIRSATGKRDRDRDKKSFKWTMGQDVRRTTKNF
ncbi:hypothetical protein K438DRAFT_1765647 [Mycena galopus ATCC 62051]|nr:hypothetical protein K438DRAFT_1765647 [Mycena galopus ATCC 62051]